jgi:exodeoxyribonuclease VII large subunit
MSHNTYKRFFNLSDITSRVQNILQPYIGKLFWVKAEISSGRERGGSFYCDLVESDDSGKIVAQMRCTIWNRDLSNIRKNLKNMIWIWYLMMVPLLVSSVPFNFIHNSVYL